MSKPSNNNKRSDVEDSSSPDKAYLPPIPFERPQMGELKKGTYVSMKLRNNPGDADSPGYDIHIKYFKEGTCEEFLFFENDLKRVFAGQAATTGPLKFATARRLFEGAALTRNGNNPLVRYLLGSSSCECVSLPGSV